MILPSAWKSWITTS